MTNQAPFAVVIKVGGNELDGAAFSPAAVAVKRSRPGVFPVIVHGGGKTIAAYQGDWG